MEKAEAGEERRRREALAKNKGKGVLLPPRRNLSLPPRAVAPSAEVRLAAIAVDLNVRLRSADMPPLMQERAFRYAKALLDANPEKKLTPTRLAMCLKKQFDGMFGLAWHCIVGKNFGSLVTYSTGGFVYFSIGKLSFLLFKTLVRPAKSPVPLRLSSNA